MRGGFPQRPETVERANRILAQVRALKEKDKNMLPVMGIRRPLWSVLSFSDTKECQRILQETYARIVSMVDPDRRLIAHGTTDCVQFVHIMEDGKLRHFTHHENYGGLSAGHDIQLGGHWDDGWGLFVAEQKCVAQHRVAAGEEKLWEMPLEDLRAIVLPSQVIAILRSEFVQYHHLLKGYKEFAEELKGS